ncbi:MAG TPA: NAD(P)-binding domain-containing protein [Solirubrobacteraceae bacterium]
MTVASLAEILVPGTTPLLCSPDMAIGVVGLGYVGLPLAVGFAEAGERIVAVDVDDAKVAAIRAGQSYVEDISSDLIQ